MSRAERVAAALRANGDTIKQWMYLNECADELADLVDAAACVAVGQACDGSGAYEAMHFDNEGRELGSEYVQCAGCCACASNRIDAAEAALAKALGVEGE